MLKSGDAPTKPWGTFVALAASVVAVLCVVEVGAAYLLGGGLVLDGPGPDCDESGKRMAQVSSESVVPAPPVGATLIEGHKDADNGCVDDSGQVWLAVDRYYRFDGDRETVIAQYRQAAEENGWTPSGSEPADVCFNKDVAGAPALLRLHVDTARTFLTSVESSLDGEPMEC